MGAGYKCLSILYSVYVLKTIRIWIFISGRVHLSWSISLIQGANQIGV